MAEYRTRATVREQIREAVQAHPGMDKAELREHLGIRPPAYGTMANYKAVLRELIVQGRLILDGDGRIGMGVWVKPHPSPRPRPHKLGPRPPPEVYARAYADAYAHAYAKEYAKAYAEAFALAMAVAEPESEPEPEPEPEPDPEPELQPVQPKPQPRPPRPSPAPREQPPPPEPSGEVRGLMAVLRDHGPLTRRELAVRYGIPFKDSRRALHEGAVTMVPKPGGASVIVPVEEASRCRCRSARGCRDARRRRGQH